MYIINENFDYGCFFNENKPFESSDIINYFNSNKNAIIEYNDNKLIITSTTTKKN